MTIEDIIKQIKQCGYWEVVLKPEPPQYDKHRFSLDDLQNLIRTHQVRHRGIPFPDISTRGNGNYYNKETFVESFTQIRNYLAAFRFYQSGQFVCYVRMVEDARGTGGSIFDPIDPQQNERYLSSVTCMYQLTEIFLFASRLATKGVFGNRANIEITLHNLKGRVLRHDAKNCLSCSDDCVCHTDKIPCNHQKTPEELQAEHDDLALKECAKILALFNFPSKYIPEALKSDQQNFYWRTY